MTDIDILTKDNVPKTLGGIQLQKVDQGGFLNILIYGISGAGKTRLAGSASAHSDLSPVILVDFEGGTLSLKESYPTVETVRVNTFKAMQDIYDELYMGKHEFKTVILDSLTEIQQMSMSTILADLIDREPGRDPDVPGMYEWNKNSAQIRRMVRAFRDLPMNTIFTALEKEDRHPRTGMRLTKPSLPGKLAGEVPGFVDMVLYLYMKRTDNDEIKRLLLTSATDEIAAKDRSGKLPLVLENPTMTSIYDTLNGETE